MKNIVLTIFITLLSVNSINAQNIIPNPGFEISTQLLTPSSTSKDTNVCWAVMEYWNDSNWTLHSSPFSVLYKSKDKAHKGLICAEIKLFDNQFDKRTYLQIPLCCKLNAGVAYRFEMYAQIVNRSSYKFGTDNIGVFFSPTLIDLNDNRRVNYTSQINNKAGAFIKCDSWTRISGYFVSKGDEQYVVIGNFEEFSKTNIKKLRNCGEKRNKSKIINIDVKIDDISLIAIGDTTIDCCKWRQEKTENEELIDINTVKTLNIGQVYVLKNVYFEFDKSDLLSDSYPELDKIYKFLTDHTELMIKVSGHTDNIGTEEYNMQLSSGRALAVVEYLVTKGLDKRRISYEGFGSAHPVVRNDTQEGRSRNRRVEFILY